MSYFKTKSLILGFCFNLFYLFGKRWFKKGGSFKVSVILLLSNFNFTELELSLQSQAVQNEDDITVLVFTTLALKFNTK